ncbi:hypothetical protein PSKAS_13080 [Peribacillus sp. N1]
MEKPIHYTIEPPENFKQLLNLYESIGWISLKLTVNDLKQMCTQSWYAIYAFDKQQLVGMGRVISDGVILEWYVECVYYRATSPKESAKKL